MSFRASTCWRAPRRRRQVELPLFYAGVTGARGAAAAVDALTRVGLGDRTDHRPDELSGGQQQRVAIARALVTKPSLLLADEPTGALDCKTTAEILDLFDELHAQGLTLVVVTHEHSVAERAERIITMSDGAVIEDVRNTPKPHAGGPLPSWQAIGATVNGRAGAVAGTTATAAEGVR